MAAKNYEQTLFFKFFVINVLGRTGWVFYPCHGSDAIQAATYLGLVVDSLRMKFYLPERKIMKTMVKIMDFCGTIGVSVHQGSVSSWGQKTLTWD